MGRHGAVPVWRLGGLEDAPLGHTFLRYGALFDITSRSHTHHTTRYCPCDKGEDLGMDILVDIPFGRTLRSLDVHPHSFPISLSDTHIDQWGFGWEHRLDQLLRHPLDAKETTAAYTLLGAHHKCRLPDLLTTQHIGLLQPPLGIHTRDDICVDLCPKVK